MENIILQEAIEYLRVFCFRNKKEMACEIGVSYRSLLNCCTGKSTPHNVNIVSAKLIRYCVKNRIALSESINLPV